MPRTEELQELGDHVSFFKVLDMQCPTLISASPKLIVHSFDLFYISFKNWSTLQLIMKHIQQKGFFWVFYTLRLDYEVTSFLVTQKSLLLEEVIREDSSKGGRKTPVVFVSQGWRPFWFVSFHISFWITAFLLLKLQSSRWLLGKSKKGVILYMLKCLKTNSGVDHQYSAILIKIDSGSLCITKMNQMKAGSVANGNR